MKDLAKLLANFNVKLKVSEETKPGEVQKALAEMAGKPEERLVSTVALRSLKQASLSDREYWALWLGGRVLHAFHIADQALS